MATQSAPIRCDIPVRILAGAYVVVPVRIESAGPYSMLVDTGTTVTQIVPAVAAALGVQSRERLVLSSPYGDRLAGRTRVSLGIGTAVATGVETAIADLAGASHVAAIDGILGLNGLRQFDFEIDYRRGRASVSKAGSGQLWPGQSLPLELDDGRPVVRATIGDGQPTIVRLVVDSGASDVVLFDGRAALERLPGVTFSGSAQALTNRGTTAVPSGRISRLSLGSLVMTDVRFAALPRRDAIDGLLPAKLLGAFAISVARGRIRIF